MADERPDPDSQVTRSVEVDADIDDVWRAVTDPGERARWLDDPDAATRRVREDERLPGHRLVWTWWHPGDEGGASTVSVDLIPGDGGGTRVVVTESWPALRAPVRVEARARAEARAAAGAWAGPRAAAGAWTGTSVGVGVRGRRSLAWVRCAVDRWESRLLGLELRFVAARAGVA
jgi:uncharacterized protein YndB with AHSA1/START domain